MNLILKRKMNFFVHKNVLVKKAAMDMLIYNL